MVLVAGPVASSRGGASELRNRINKSTLMVHGSWGPVTTPVEPRKTAMERV